MNADRIYLAARYSRKPEIKQYAFELQSFGKVVTSRWLHEHYDNNVSMTELSDNVNREIALYDVADIDSSDAVVFFSEDQNNQPPRGGRHVEFGYALAKKIPIYVIGERENIFHHLPQIKVYSTWPEFLLGECW